MGEFGATISKIAAMLLSGEETSKILYTKDLVYKFDFVYQEVNSSNKVYQEPITRSVQLPYSVCETAFSQVGLFLDQPFSGIRLRFFRLDLFISFGFS